MDRVRKTMRDALLFTAAICLTVSIILFALRSPLEMLFQLDGEARRLMFLFAGPLSLLFFFNGVIFVGNAAFNNLGHPFYSTWINWGRHTLGTVPFVMFGAWWLGAPGVLIGQSVGGVLFGLLSWWMALRLMARDGQGDTPDKVAHQMSVFRLFHNRRY